MSWNNELIKSAKQGNLEKVKECLANDADVNAKNKYCRTALMYALEKGYFEIVKYLVKNGADMNAKDKYGGTAIDLAKNDEIRAFLEKNKN